MATPTDRQKKAMGIFQFVLELLLSLFKSHHGDQRETTNVQRNTFTPN